MILQNIELITVADLSKLDIEQLEQWTRNVVEYLITAYENSEDTLLSEDSLLEISRYDEDSEFEIAIINQGVNCAFKDAITVQKWWEAKWDDTVYDLQQAKEEAERDKEIEIEDESKKLHEKWAIKEEEERQKQEEKQEEERQEFLSKFFAKVQKERELITQLEDENFTYNVGRSTARSNNNIYLYASESDELYAVFYIKRNESEIMHVQYDLISKQKIIKLWKQAHEQTHDLLLAREMFYWDILANVLNV